MTGIHWALKEWAIAIEALLAGEFILLLRKGGIREPYPSFQVPSRQVLLFPTYEHPRAEALRSPYAERLAQQPRPEIGQPMTIAGWAQITHQVNLSGTSAVAPLHPFHIWTDAWLMERLRWQPDRPAYGLLLRAHRFTTPAKLPYQRQYGGCRSWIEITSSSLPESTPVLSEATYDTLATNICMACSASS